MTTKRAKSGGRKISKAGAQHSEPEDLRLLAREAALAALQRLADLSRSEDERVALAATQELLNRAFGKASAANAEEQPAGRALIIKIVRFGDTESAGANGDRQS